MKPEKMTDEEIANATADTYWLGRLRAHIAALTAERDAVVTLLDAERVPSVADEEETGRKCDLAGRVQLLVNARDNLTMERDALRKRGRALKDERETLGRRAERAEVDARALEKRVQALEKERRDAEAREHDAHSDRDKAQAMLRQSERRLSAMLQRAGDEEALVRKGEVCAIMGSPRTEWDEAIHADVVGRHDETTVRDVAIGIARYVVGEDATGADDAADAVQRERDREGWEEPPASPEPSTAEAFATVRDRITGRPSLTTDAEALDALSLLERRMGAQARALEGLKAAHLAGGDLRVCWPLWRAVDEALTDAPPVFTPEEVEHAVWSRLGRSSDAEAILAALRKGTP